MYISVSMYFVFWHPISGEIQKGIQNTLSLTPPVWRGVAADVLFDHPLFAQDPC